ncbi:MULTISPECIES: signal peptidase I [unclassified Geodermatophilus]
MSRRASAAEPAAGNALVRRLRRLVSWVLGLVLVTSTAAALGIALYPAVTGGSALAVLSGSMTPGLPVGGMVFTRTADTAEVEPGDVITFQRRPGAPELVTHRVVAVDTTSGVPVFTTRGDANDAPDLDPVPASSVRGELWFAVPHLGRLAAVLHSPKGAGLLIVLVCAAVAASPGARPRTSPGHDAHPAPFDDTTVRLPAVRPAATPPAAIGLVDRPG